MNEEQDKLIENWLKKCSADNRLRKHLTIIALLFIVCAITSFIVVMSIPGTGTTPPSGYYRATKSEIQAAVQGYQDNNGDGLPTINGTVTINDSLFYIINICALIGVNDEMLLDVPDSCISINGSNNDNCDAGCEGCWEYSHYIWAVDDSGNVFSSCVGSDCIAYNTDGYQGVWP